MFDSIKLPRKAFKCAICSEISGTCEHTVKVGKPIHGAKVIVVGIIEGYRFNGAIVCEVSEIDFTSYCVPETKIFYLEMVTEDKIS